MGTGEIYILLMLLLYLCLAFTLDLALHCWDRGHGAAWIGMVVFQTLSMLLVFLLLVGLWDALKSWGF